MIHYILYYSKLSLHTLPQTVLLIKWRTDPRTDMLKSLPVCLICRIILSFDIIYHLFSDDHSRVVLELYVDNPGSDYINANVIDVSWYMCV